MYKAKAVGFRVLVKPDAIVEKTVGGIVLALDEKLEKGAQVKGVVIDVGPEAYRAFNRAAGFDDYRPWVKPGDHVYYAKYSGKRIIEGTEELLFLNDEDIAGLVE